MKGRISVEKEEIFDFEMMTGVDLIDDTLKQLISSFDPIRRNARIKLEKLILDVAFTQHESKSLLNEQKPRLKKNNPRG